MSVLENHQPQENGTRMDIQEVMAHLPHRHPFLLIDRVLSYEVGKSLRAVKNVTYTEPWFTGHFPEQAVMPGVLMLEAIAQAAGILAYKSLGTRPDGKSLFYLAGIDNARFKQMVQPGDQLIIDVSFLKHKASIWKISGVITVDGAEVCSADVLSAHKEIEA